MGTAVTSALAQRRVARSCRAASAACAARRSWACASQKAAAESAAPRAVPARRRPRRDRPRRARLRRAPPAAAALPATSAPTGRTVTRRTRLPAAWSSRPSPPGACAACTMSSATRSNELRSSGMLGTPDASGRARSVSNALTTAGSSPSRLRTLSSTCSNDRRPPARIQLRHGQGQACCPRASVFLTCRLLLELLECRPARPCAC